LRGARRILAATAFALAAAVSQAQSIEPRNYSNAPVGVSFAVAGYAYTRGGIAFDPSLPVDDVNLHTSSTVFAYARTLDLWGKSGKFDVVMPYTWLSGSATFAGAPVERVVNGLSDPSARIQVNLYGSPALALKEFGAYEQDLIVGASLQVFAPLGQYDSARLVNLSTHRWSFKPEIGISQAIGELTLEGKAAVTIFTDNRDFYGGQVRSQDPIYSVSGHAIYSFRSGRWWSFDATYFGGGRSKLNGSPSNDLQQNWRLGATVSLPVDRFNSVKLYASSGVSARTGNNYDLIGIAWQHRWGGGL
jgi:hypothetical protein